MFLQQHTYIFKIILFTFTLRIALHFFGWATSRGGGGIRATMISLGTKFLYRDDGRTNADGEGGG